MRRLIYIIKIDDFRQTAFLRGTALVAAEQLRIKTRAIEQFPLEEPELAMVARLPALPAKIKTKLAKKNAVTTRACVISPRWISS